MTELRQSLHTELPELARAAYPYWTLITTRWMDNDMYGHVNNVQYYSFFDTVVTRWLIQEAGLRPASADVIGLCVESGCEYHAPLSFPDDVLAGLRAGRVGKSSVRYEIVIYSREPERPAATGHFVHVYVDRDTRRSTPIPDALRRRLEELVVVEDSDAA